ncbi:MAG: esterase [Pseudomonadota bacterium]|nr:esterase [Pseudomonadota bacterium]
MPVTHLLYLHGFRSSPNSTKARAVAAWVAAHRPGLVWSCPQMPASPRQAMAGLLDLVAAWPHECMAVMGSSLGGFYATSLAERLGCRAVLLNPAIDPARDLAQAIGGTTAWHSGEPFDFRAEYVDELRALAAPAELTRRERYLAVIATGDEVLSWHEMSARYAGCRIRLVDGSDHALSDFDAHWPAIVDFLGL